MIDFLCGKLVHRETEYVIVEVNGIGYRVFCANPFALGIKSEQETTVFIHYHVREDAILLYGFESREQQTLFRKLLEVSGIGPRVALGILSVGRPEAVVAAIQQENLNELIKLPGIGRKTAQRMILDLKDKLDQTALGKLAGVHLIDGDSFADSRQSEITAWSEAKAALLALGYTEAETDKAWHGIREKLTDSDKPDTLIKLALQTFYKG